MQDYIQSAFGEFEEKLNDPSATPRGCRYCHPSWTDYIDIDSFVDYMLVQELSKNVDGYRLSTYFHKQADSDGGLFVMGPIWDVNLGFDNADYVSCCRRSSSKCMWVRLASSVRREAVTTRRAG